MIHFIFECVFCTCKKTKQKTDIHAQIKKKKKLSKCVSHLNAWSLGWTCSPELGSEVTGCVLVSRARFPLMTVSGLKRTDCG